MIICVLPQACRGWFCCSPPRPLRGKGRVGRGATPTLGIGGKGRLTASPCTRSPWSGVHPATRMPPCSCRAMTSRVLSCGKSRQLLEMTIVLCVCRTTRWSRSSLSSHNLPVPSATVMTPSTSKKSTFIFVQPRTALHEWCLPDEEGYKNASLSSVRGGKRADIRATRGSAGPRPYGPSDSCGSGALSHSRSLLPLRSCASCARESCVSISSRRSGGGCALASGQR